MTENGIIEIRFGDIDLENCSFYIPGQGFDFDGLYGPWVLLMDQEESEGICTFGDYGDPSTGEGFYTCGLLSSIPPNGSVIQFGPSIDVGIDDQGSNETLHYSIILANDIVEIEGDIAQFEKTVVYDLSGRRLLDSSRSSFSTSNFINGIYIIEIQSTSGTEFHKVMLL